MPIVHARAIVTQIIKQDNSDTADLKYYRPASNLSFPSKLIERTVSEQINTHNSLHRLDKPLESEYKLGIVPRAH